MTAETKRALDPDILTIEELAEVLRCSVDTLRRVSLSELPAYRVGRHNLYLREDVIRFLRKRRVERPNVDELLEEIAGTVEGDSGSVVGFEPVGVRGLPARRTP